MSLASSLMLFFLALLYFLPTLIAWFQDSRLTTPIFIVNLFLGWTFFGWVAALAMAFLK